MAQADVGVVPPIRILMLEDSALDAELILAQLTRARLDFVHERVWQREAFIEAVQARRHDVILADHVLPGFDGDSALVIAHAIAPEVPFIFVSGTLTEELAVQALTRGARDYVVKQRLQRLPDAILRAVREDAERNRRVEVETELKRAGAQLQLITHALPALIAHFGPDHRYRFANAAHEDWFGLSPADMAGHPMASAVGEAAFAELVPHLQALLGGERVRFQAALPHRDGTSHFVQMDGVPEQEADGSVIGYFILARDISDLKDAENALRDSNTSLQRLVQQRTAELKRSEGRLLTIFESSFQHQILLSPDGVVIDANVASLAAVLASKEQVSGRLFADSVWFSATPDAGARVRTALQAAADGEASGHELELNLPTGLRSFEFSFRPLLDPTGGVTAIVAEAVETTARRQAEDALRQSQKIEAIGQLTGGIAHDFNNILTVIAGNVEHAMLLNERLGDAAAAPARALDNALKGVMRAASLTQRLLAFARRQPLKNEAVDLSVRVAAMQDMLQRTLGELVQLELHAAADVWCVELDPAQLEASVLNLAVNARDAMPEGGHLVIDVGNVHLDADQAAQYRDVPAGEYAMLRVRDTGQGMDSATLERVFEPFFTTKEVGRGTGLGLPMVYGFVKQSGGQVLVESSPGNGTLVTILFPRSLLPLPEARQVDSALMGSLEGRNENILVAEDNDDVRAYTVESLRQLGYRVLEAHDGPSALRLLDRPDVHVDLLFSDVVMPGMSGWELARQVRLRNSDMRILFTSGYPRDLGMKGNPGANVALLAKPFTRSDLGRAVRAALEGPSQAG